MTWVYNFPVRKTIPVVIHDARATWVAENFGRKQSET